MENAKDNLNDARKPLTNNKTDRETSEASQNEWHDHAETDKYLALEQEGVTFTQENNPTIFSDNKEQGEQGGDIWEANRPKSRNAEAFNQDDYLLNDNIDLEEDQNQSISSDDV